MGKVRPDANLFDFGQQLAAAILTRMGNQKINYVKLYAARAGESITSECRINDSISPEISTMLAGFAQSLSTGDFASQKMFIFFVQEDETYMPYPHTSAQLAEYTHDAIQIFYDFTRQKAIEKYIMKVKDGCNTLLQDESALFIPDSQSLPEYTEILSQKIGDIQLARELSLFIPELVAELAYPCIYTDEFFEIITGNHKETIYKNQHPAYYHIQSALKNELQSGSELTKATFGIYVEMSTTGNLVKSVKGSEHPPVEAGGYTLILCYDFINAVVHCDAKYDDSNTSE